MMWAQPSKRTLPVALLALALLGGTATAWAQTPRAERPSYTVGDKWIRSDGAYDLIRIDNGHYVFAADGGREVHLTRDLGVAKVVRGGKTLLEMEPPPAVTWPLEVGQWGVSWLTFKTPDPQYGQSLARLSWRVEAYEDVRVPAGVFNVVLGLGHNAGRMLAEHGDVEGARSAYQRAIDSNHPDAAPVAANDLGTLLSQAGDVEGARAAYQRAIETGGPELSPPASLNLGILLARHSDIKGARAALEVAIHSDHRQASQWGSYYLGVLLTEERDAKGALAAFQAAVDGDDAEASRLAANAMASLGKRQS